MIFGITLKRWNKLLQTGKDASIEQLQKPSKRKFKTVVLEDIPIEDFVSLERFLEELNYYEFCRIFVRKKFWQRIYVHNMFGIIEQYKEQKDVLIERYYYVFNPTQYGIPAPETIASELKKDFVNEFGPWVVLMDVVTKGRIVDYPKIKDWSTKDFLFWANYYTGQKIIESVK